MSLNRMLKYFITIRHLKFGQIYWRVFFIFKKQFFSQKNFYAFKAPQSKYFSLCTSLLQVPACYLGDNTFIFINKSHKFHNVVDWNFSDLGRLWVYNLNYFDFLNQSEMDRMKGLELIKHFCHEIYRVKDGLEPYPTSLRCINWIKFLVRYEIKDEEIESVLWAQINHLSKNLEFHILGNHLLENGFALLFGAVYFDNEKLYKKARKLVAEQLNEQILEDGAHFELSPMYHQIILGRLLDIINIVKPGSNLAQSFLMILEEKAKIMLGWINAMSFRNGNIPLFNDSAFKIAPNTQSLLLNSQKLGIYPSHIKLGASGYRKYVANDNLYECIFDIGQLGPDYQPGHAHADTFTFELYFKGQPFIVDTGTSTYERVERRAFERSTRAHNTVELFQRNSSDVWAAHRVGRRAKVTIEFDEKDFIRACHDGYKHKGVIHQRTFIFQQNSFKTLDHIFGPAKCKDGRAYLHFAPGFTVTREDNKLIVNDNLTVEFEGNNDVILFEYMYAPEFNKLVPATGVKIDFTDKLETLILLDS